MKVTLRFERDADVGCLADDVRKALKKLGLKVKTVRSDEDEINLVIENDAKETK